MMKILVAVFAYNEGEKIKATLSRHPKKRTYKLLVADDGSTDGSLNHIPPSIIHLKNKKNKGIGFMMKRVFQYAIANKYDVLVIEGGNNKDNPLEIPRLLSPLLSKRADFVQGSRLLEGGAYKNIPFYRIIAIRYIHPLLMSLFTRKKVTESTNGFRAFRVELLKDKRINWKQPWLDKYELEPYLLFKTIVLGYRHVEVPVSKVYPVGKISYTKMRPLIGWWSILKPVIALGFGLRK